MFVSSPVAWSYTAHMINGPVQIFSNTLSSVVKPKQSQEKSLEELKKAHESKDIAQIDAAMEKINEAWKAASEEIYKAPIYF